MPVVCWVCPAECGSAVCYDTNHSDAALSVCWDSVAQAEVAGEHAVVVVQQLERHTQPSCRGTATALSKAAEGGTPTKPGAGW